MKLTLRLTGPNTQAGQNRVLVQGRLSIGRGAENDWVLADPDRVLSKNHCQIEVSGPGFLLTDLSTNGVFLSGQKLPLGRGNSCAIEDGDRFSLGPYMMRADIEDEETEALQPGPGIGLSKVDNGSVFSPADGTSHSGLRSPILPAIAEPWLTDVPSGEFGPGRRAAPQGWEAPPDPASFAASGTFELRDPLATASSSSFGQSDTFSQMSEHLAAPSAVMRLPQTQVVLPNDWNEAQSDSQVETLPAFGTGVTETFTQDVAAWPPTLPTQAEEPALPPVLAPEWMASEPGIAYVRPDPPACLPASWSATVSATADAPDLDTELHQIVEIPLASVPARDEDSQSREQFAAYAVPDHVASLSIPAVVSAGEPVIDATHAPDGAAGLIAAFLEGAGLPPDTLHGMDTEASFREIGQMVRAAVDGLREILATRALVKSEFRVEQTVLRRSDNNAMKFAPDGERCLAAMVGATPPGFLPGYRAMQQSMNDIKLHELALVAAINTVFADLGRQLDPEAIMARAKQETGLTTMLPYARELKCWAIYTETHATLQNSGAHNTAGSLLAPVAQAYERQLKRSSR